MPCSQQLSSTPLPLLHYYKRVLTLLLCLGMLSACSTLPPLDHRTPSVTIRDTAHTRIGKVITKMTQAHPGTSGIFPLQEGRDAFAARVVMTEAADKTLDVQYYIWHNDQSGTLLFDALRRAADRGVRVRLLIDDNNTAGLDAILAMLDAHPNIEVRLFNPFVPRRPRIVSYLTDFSRVNRRMHNKSFTADNQITIIGGRNIGDEYFDAGEELSFADLDVIAVGPVVDQVSTNFDRYWSSESAYPVDRILPPADAAASLALATKAATITHAPAATAYMQALRESTFMQDLIAAKLQFEWAVTHMVSDDPAKGLGQADPHDFLREQLTEVIGKPISSLDLISPYFVPRPVFIETLQTFAGEGVKIRLLTNSLEATDVAVVHAGYAKWRKPLLESGITLYELKRRAAHTSHHSRIDIRNLSRASLHAKTFAIDQSRVFIGSFNLDQRSSELNTEMGFVIDSPVLAKAVSDLFETTIPIDSYEVRLSTDGHLYWLEKLNEDESLLYHTEPGTSFSRRTGVRFMSLLPLEWLL